MRVSIRRIEEMVCDWGVSPAQYVLRFEKTCDTDDVKCREMVEHCNEEGIWCISDLVYLDSEDEAIMFALRWS